MNWEVFDTPNGVGVSEVDGYDIAHCSGFDFERSREEELANARLIAAAPDLLKAAAIALTDLYLKADKDEIPKEWTSVKVLLAAIAKATGEAS